MRRLLAWIGAFLRSPFIEGLALLLFVRLWLDLVLPGNWARFIAMGIVLGWLLLRDRKRSA